MIDQVAVRHLELIDEKGGSYYEFLRKIGINQQLELFEEMVKNKALPTFKTATGI